MDHVVALHGFAGTGRSWDGVRAALGPAPPPFDAPDLPGHGEAAGLGPISFPACVARVLEGAPERFVLVGYSLGGRVALHVALAAPERVRKLILVSTTAGIEDDDERAERRERDHALADELEALPIVEVARRWSEQPVFAGDPLEARARQVEDVMRNDPARLADALRELGPGAMPPLWHRLGELGMPAIVAAGERDERYAELARRLAAALGGPAEAAIIPGAGHGLPREAPAAVAALLRR